MANGLGGTRPGAGRRTSAQIEAVRALLSELVSEESWKNMIKSVTHEAECGHLPSVAFLLALRYGVIRPRPPARRTTLPNPGATSSHAARTDLQPALQPVTTHVTTTNPPPDTL